MAVPAWRRAGFDSPEAYQREVDRKISAGKPLDKPELYSEFQMNQSGVNYQGGSMNMPTMPILETYTPTEFQAPQQKALSFTEALGQAKQMFEPQYQEARVSAGRTNQQQSNLMAQRLASRGQLSGGLAIEGQLGLARNLSDALTQLNTAYQTATTQQADQMVQRRAEENFRNLQFAYQQWADAEQLRAQAVQSGNQQASQYYEMAVQQAQDAYNRYWNQLQFDYQKEQDAIRNRQAARSGGGGSSSSQPQTTPSGITHQPAGDPIQDQVTEMRKRGMDDFQIWNTLVNQGIDPRYYGVRVAGDKYGNAQGISMM